MDCIAHGVTKSRTRLSDFHSLTSKRIKFSKGGKMHFLSFHRNIHYWFYNQTITVTKVREVSHIHFGKHRKLVKKKKKVEKAAWQATELQGSGMTEAI